MKDEKFINYDNEYVAEALAISASSISTKYDKTYNKGISDETRRKLRKKRKKRKRK